MPDGNTLPPREHNNPPPYSPDKVDAHSAKVAEFLDAAGAQADYATFAMAPTGGGAAIEGEFVEGAAGESDASGDQEAAHEVQKKEGAATAKDAKPKTKAKDTAKTEDHDAPADLRAKYDEIVASMTDGAPPDATMNFYAADIARMESDAPKLHAELMEEFASFEAAG